MNKPNSRKHEILSLSFPAGSLEKIIDYAKKHNLSPAKLTDHDMQDIAAKLGIPTYFGDFFEALKHWNEVRRRSC
jgi:hypothetical protein